MIRSMFRSKEIFGVCAVGNLLYKQLRFWSDNPIKYSWMSRETVREPFKDGWEEEHHYQRSRTCSRDDDRASQQFL